MTATPSSFFREYLFPRRGQSNIRPEDDQRLRSLGDRKPLFTVTVRTFKHLNQQIKIIKLTNFFCQTTVSKLYESVNTSFSKFVVQEALAESLSLALSLVPSTLRGFVSDLLSVPQETGSKADNYRRDYRGPTLVLLTSRPLTSFPSLLFFTFFWSRVPSRLPMSLDARVDRSEDRLLLKKTSLL